MQINGKLTPHRIVVQLSALVKKDFNILNNIPVKVLAKLKQKEEHPFLQAYVLCHPGEFTPEIVGEKSVPIVWDLEAVKSLTKIDVVGKKLFLGHDTRKVLGEIVHGLMHNDTYIIIAYHKPDQVEEASKCDICSQETIWYTFEDKGIIYADKAKELLGVAIQQSKVEAPAFSGATKLSEVYATEQKSEKEIVRMPITLAEIQQGVKDLNVQPYQVFDVEMIKNDVKIGHVFTKLEAENSKLKESVEAKDNKIKELSEAKTEIEKNIAKSTATARLDKIVKENKCTEKQAEFISKRFSKAELESYDDDGLASFVENVLDIYKDLSGITSESDDDGTPPNDSDKSDDDYEPTDFDPDNL